MGKKRRLKSAKGKFKAKCSEHPRMKHLDSIETNLEDIPAETPPEVVLQEVEAAPQEEKPVTKPKAAPKRKRTKKATTTRRKTTKKTAQNATA